jgi:hypothetical protein
VEDSGCKTYWNDSECSNTIASSDSKLYYLLFSVLAASSVISCTVVMFDRTYNKISVRIYMARALFNLGTHCGTVFSLSNKLVTHLM